jgi:hypothetical protein
MVALLVGGLSLPAEAVLISTLQTSGGTITVGDKIFSNFTCSVTGTGASCTTIDVVGVIDPVTGLIGLTFQAPAFNNTPNTNLDILINYTATVLPGFNNLISDVHLGFNGSVTGSGFINVTETVRGPLPGSPNNVLGQAFVQNPPPIFTSDILLSAPASSIRVTKDILLGVGTTAGSASLSFVDQFLSQTPEPGSLALLGTAFFGWGVAMRRRFRG